MRCGRPCLKHDDVLRTAIEKHEGFLFSHTGDGVVAAFASPRSAVDAAIAAQRALELPVGMGIATGEAELRGGDYFGTVLNRAARVMAARSGPPAHPVRLGLHQELIRQFPLIDRIRRGHGIHRGRHHPRLPAKLSSACRPDPDQPLIRQPHEEHGWNAEMAQFRCG